MSHRFIWNYIRKNQTFCQASKIKFGTRHNSFCKVAVNGYGVIGKRVADAVLVIGFGLCTWGIGKLWGSGERIVAFERGTRFRNITRKRRENG